MENRFHLAIPAGDLDKAIKFYCDTLGCSRGNAEFNSLYSGGNIKRNSAKSHNETHGWIISRAKWLKSLETISLKKYVY